MTVPQAMTVRRVAIVPPVMTVRLMVADLQRETEPVAAGTADLQGLRPDRRAATMTASGTAAGRHKIAATRRPARAAGAHGIRADAVRAPGRVRLRLLATGPPGPPATGLISAAGATRWPRTCGTSWECAPGREQGQLRVREPGEGSGRVPTPEPAMTAMAMRQATGRCSGTGTTARRTAGDRRTAGRRRAAGAMAATAAPGMAVMAAPGHVSQAAAGACGNGCCTAAGGGTGPGGKR